MTILGGFHREQEVDDPVDLCFKRTGHNAFCQRDEGLILTRIEDLRRPIRVGDPFPRALQVRGLHQMPVHRMGSRRNRTGEHCTQAGENSLKHFPAREPLFGGSSIREYRQFRLFPHPPNLPDD